MKLRAALSASASEVILSLGEIRSEARLWNLPQSVNFSTWAEGSLVLTWSSMWKIIGRWSESKVSDTVISYSRTFWWTSMSRTSPFPAGEFCVGLFGADIWNSLISNKSSNFSPEGFEIALFQNGFLAFRSPANTVLFLIAKSFMMSASLHVRLGG